MDYLKASQKAQFGRDLIKDAVVQLLVERKEPMTNAEIVKALGIPSDFEGENSSYLSWSILGLLVNEGVIKYSGAKHLRKYFLNTQVEGL
jgi:hypothetical protein